MDKGTEKKEVVLICEDVRSLWNVGAMFRTADALGVSKIYLCGITGRPPGKEISKVALGAEEWIPWEYRAVAWELVRDLRAQGYLVIALEKTKSSVPLATLTPPSPLLGRGSLIALVVGNEVRGVSKETLAAVEKVISIPMVGRKESLNVAVAAGIALYGILHLEA